ncbi:MAG: NAD(P)/FAD-dependent oxidoreductase, partial [Roseburia sp.]|nr:NAD(P)/FAD-dependent oxidoreductase [Roseburia sp.]
GGECMGWNRKGCHIDNCIHWLTGTKKGTELRKVWETVGALDEHTKFVDGDSFYTSITGDVRVTLWKDLDRTKAELLKLSPEDEEEIKKFIEHVRYAMECEVPAEKPMDAFGIGDYIHMGASMANMPKVMKEYGSIDLKELADRFKHPALKALFTDYMPKDYVASSYLVSYATMVSGNGEIPAGGSLAMTNRMVKRFRNLGGKLYCNVPVSRILIKDKKAVGIETADKKQILADYVISAVDTMEMFDRLMGKKYMDAKWKSCYADMEKYPLFSAVQAAFMVDREAYNEKETIFFDCAPFETGGRKVDRISVKSYEYEPEFAPEGKTVLQVNVPQFDQEYLYWKGLTKEEYENQKKEAIRAIEERILAQFPGLQGHMEILDCWTPLTYERYCNAYHGAYMAFITKKGVKSFRVKGVVKGVKNLYVASQWIMAPGGLPVAVTAGKFAVWRIAKKDKK